MPNCDDDITDQGKHVSTSRLLHVGVGRWATNALSGIFINCIRIRVSMRCHFALFLLFATCVSSTFVPTSQPTGQPTTVPSSSLTCSVGAFVNNQTQCLLVPAGYFSSTTSSKSYRSCIISSLPGAANCVGYNPGPILFFS